jgi:cellulose synthase (UDP-forming)
VSKISGDEETIRLRFGTMPLARRRELVRVVLARADAWIQPEYKQDNPLVSLGTIIRTVFELFWLSWKDRREARKRDGQATAKEDSAA